MSRDRDNIDVINDMFQKTLVQVGEKVLTEAGRYASEMAGAPGAYPDPAKQLLQPVETGTRPKTFLPQFSSTPAFPQERSRPRHTRWAEISLDDDDRVFDDGRDNMSDRGRPPRPEGGKQRKPPAPDP